MSNYFIHILSPPYKMISIYSVLLLATATIANAACSATISSLADVAAAVKCTSITLNGFTVPAGQGLTLSLASGTTVTMAGDINFGNKSWAGPLFTVSGTGVTFNGNGHTFNGGGPFYWDGLGINGGTTKPDPMMKVKISGTFENVKVVNSPGRVFSIGNSAPLLLTGLTIDNSQGDAPNSMSNGLAAGHNTDGFDVSANDVTIQNSVIHNQDDCLALNKGTNIVFKGNSCTGGHGISIGSIDSDVTVSGVVISGNTITNNDQALRIKMKSSASGSTVSNVTYSGNTATGIRQFGVIIDQSYPSTLGTPGTGVILSGVNFVAPASTITVNSGADKVAVNCGKGACTGTWNWSNLKVNGGVAGPITNAVISGFSQ
jgi:polygalacturonase